MDFIAEISEVKNNVIIMQFHPYSHQTVKIVIHAYIITHEMQTPSYSVKWTGFSVPLVYLDCTNTHSIIWTLHAFHAILSATTCVA